MYRGGVRVGLRPIGATVARQIPVLKVTRSNRVSVTEGVNATLTVHPRSCAICFLACHPHVGVCVRLKSRWPYHRAGGAPPMAEAMGGKEEGPSRRGATRVAGRVARVARRHRQGAGRVRQVGGGPRGRSPFPRPFAAQAVRSPSERNSQTVKLLILNILTGGGFQYASARLNGLEGPT